MLSEEYIELSYERIRDCAEYRQDCEGDADYFFEDGSFISFDWIALRQVACDPQGNVLKTVKISLKKG